MGQAIRDGTNRWWKEIIVGLCIACVLWVMAGLSEAKGDFKVIKNDITAIKINMKLMNINIDKALYKRYTSDDAKADLEKVSNDAKADLEKVNEKIGILDSKLQENKEDDIRGHNKE